MTSPQISKKDPGSFRDPSGFIFYQNGKYFILDPKSQMFWRISSEFVDDSVVLETKINILAIMVFLEKMIKQKIHFPLHDLISLI